MCMCHRKNELDPLAVVNPRQRVEFVFPMAHTHPKLLMCASVHWFQVFSLIDLPINRGNPVTIRGETVRPALTLQGQISPIRRMKPHGFPAIRPTIRKAHRRSLHFWMTTHRAWLGPAIGLAAGALGLAYTIRRWNSTRLSSALARTGLPQRSKRPARDGPFAFSKLRIQSAGERAPQS